MKKINYIYLILLSSISFCYSVEIHEYFQELHEDYRAETVIYKLLKKSPFKKKVNFIYAPWYSLERNSRANLKPNLSDLAHLRFNNAFTVCSFDNYERLLPFFKSIGIKTVFSSSGNNTNFKGVDIVTIPYFARNCARKLNVKKDIFYSFVGNVRSHSIRSEIFKLPHPKNTVLIKRDRFHYNNPDPNLIKKMEREYLEILLRSRFSLCPRGGSAGTYRFWESLQAGSIPVLISDDYKLPEGFDWSSCIVVIKQSDIKNILPTLLKISKEKEQQMRQKCYQAYDFYCGNNFSRIIKRYFAKKHN